MSGSVQENACIDTLKREFHCGTGLPWPDKDGKSSNPEVYEAWLEQQKQLPSDMFEGGIDKHIEDDKVD